MELVPENLRRKNGAEQNGDSAEHTEEMHRFLPESAYEQDRQQVQEAIDKSLQPELGATILPLAMLNDFLGDLRESSPLGNERNVPVHLTIHCNIFYNRRMIGLQPAIK